jgi:hypothetical protein
LIIYYLIKKIENNKDTKINKITNKNKNNIEDEDDLILM